MKSGLVSASFSLPEWQAVRMSFFAPCLSNTVTSLLWPLFFVGYTFPYIKPLLMWSPVNMANDHILKSPKMESPIISPR